MTTPDSGVGSSGQARPGRGRRIAIIVLGVLIALGLALVARLALLNARDSIANGDVIFTSAYTVSGALRPGDLVVAASESILLDAVAITGSVSLVAESVQVNGTISGDLTILAPNVLLQGAQIGGALHILSENVTVTASTVGSETLIHAEILLLESSTFIDPPAVCAGIVNDTRSGGTLAPCPAATLDPFQDVIALRERAQASPTMSLILGALAIVGLSAGVSALVTAVTPDRVGRMARGMRRHPVNGVAIGLGVYALAVGLASATVALLGLIPLVGALTLLLGVLAAIALLIVIVAGWVGLALLVGSRLTGAPAPAAAAIGGAIIGAVMVFIALLPIPDALVLLLLAALTAISTGTAFGTRLGSGPRLNARPVEVKA